MSSISVCSICSLYLNYFKMLLSILTFLEYIIFNILYNFSKYCIGISFEKACCVLNVYSIASLQKMLLFQLPLG